MPGGRPRRWIARQLPNRKPPRHLPSHPALGYFAVVMVKGAGKGVTERIRWAKVAAGSGSRERESLLPERGNESRSGCP